MAAKTIAILGGGWGGLALAHDLRGLLAEEHRILVVERSERFMLGMSSLSLLTGERTQPDVQRPMSRLARPGIEWVHDEVEAIDPATRTVRLGSGELHPDYLVVALGAEHDSSMVPGLADAAHNLYDAAGATALRQALSALDGGRVVVLVARMPFRCPAAPYEAAFLIESMLRHAGVRARTEIAVYTPEKQPMPVAGPAVGEALVAMLAERNIDYHPERPVSAVDGSAVFGSEEVAFDLLAAVLPHRAPRVVVDAGLTDATGYIPVHPQTLETLGDADTLETRFPGVFAIGDVTSVRLMNSMLLPKAGIFAEGEARVVAGNIAADIAGDASRSRFDGHGFCYVEIGDGMAARGSGNFFAYPGPTVTLDPPSAEYKRAKQEFERVLDSWFR